MSTPLPAAGAAQARRDPWWLIVAAHGPRLEGIEDGAALGDLAARALEWREAGATDAELVERAARWLDGAGDSDASPTAPAPSSTGPPGGLWYLRQVGGHRAGHRSGRYVKAQAPSSLRCPQRTTGSADSQKLRVGKPLATLDVPSRTV